MEKYLGMTTHLCFLPFTHSIDMPRKDLIVDKYTLLITFLGHSSVVRLSCTKYSERITGKGYVLNSLAFVYRFRTVTILDYDRVLEIIILLL